MHMSAGTIPETSSKLNGRGSRVTTGTGFRNFPLLNFALPEERERMHTALASVRKQFGQQWSWDLDGRKLLTRPGVPKGPQWAASYNPSNSQEVVGYVKELTADEAMRVLGEAAEQFFDWSRQSVEERAVALEGAAQYMADNRYEYNAWCILEAGKPWREADGDVAEAIDFLNYYAAEMRQLASPTPTQVMPGETNEYEYRPFGPGVVISPWNFPMAIPCGMIGAALVAGNPVVLKPAEQTPICAALVVKALCEGGKIPPGVLGLVFGKGEVVGEALVTDVRTHFVAFTGSVPVGLRINELAAKVLPGKDHVTRVIAEMGGKNALLIDSSADLNAAVNGAVKSAFFYAGQKCSAASRVIVLESVYDEFLHRLRRAAASLVVGPAEDPATQVGPVIDPESVERVKSYGGSMASVAGAAEKHQFLAPTIVENVSTTDRVFREEIFGPVMAVVKVQNMDEAIRVANDSRFALTAGIFTRTPDHIDRARQELECGNLYVNRPITGAIVGRQPFGGYKMSGIGSKAGGPDYLKQFLVPRTFTENTMRHGFAPLDDL